MVVTGKDQRIAAQLKARGVPKAFQKSELIESGASHFGDRDLIAKSQAIVGFAEIELAVHGIAASVAAKAGQDKVQIKPGNLTGSCI